MYSLSQITCNPALVAHANNWRSGPPQPVADIEAVVNDYCIALCTAANLHASWPVDQQGYIHFNHSILADGCSRFKGNWRETSLSCLRWHGIESCQN